MYTLVFVVLATNAIKKWKWKSDKKGRIVRKIRRGGAF